MPTLFYANASIISIATRSRPPPASRIVLAPARSGGGLEIILPDELECAALVDTDSVAVEPEDEAAFADVEPALVTPDDDWPEDDFVDVEPAVEPPEDV